jgi:hypothetical protein
VGTGMAGPDGAERLESSRGRPRADESLEGWVPALGPDLTLAEVIELAFDYRGNTTIVKTDGTEVAGYLFNRDAAAREPFIQMFDEAGDGPITIPYAQIANVAFTGRDTAAGSSWKAWRERKAQEQAVDLLSRPDRA